MKPTSLEIKTDERITALESKIKRLENDQSSNLIFRHFFNESRDLVCIANLEGYFTIVNPAFTELLGYTEEELLSKPFIYFTHPDDVNKTDEEVALMNSEGRSTLKFENRYITKDGRIVYLEWNSTVDEKTKTIFAIARDITEDKIIEEKLKRSEQLLNETQSISKTGSWSLVLETNELYWSDEMYKIYEIDHSLQGSELSNAFIKTFTEKERENLNVSVQNALENGVPYSLERQLEFADGSKKWIRGTGIPIQDKNGKVFKLEGIAQDVTEQKLYNEKLKNNEALLKAAQTMAKLGSWSFDIKTLDLFWSDELYNIFELPNEPNPNLYQDFLNRLSQEDRIELDEKVKNAIEKNESYTVEQKLTFSDGRVKWILGSGAPISDSSGNIVRLEGFLQDITEQKITQLTILNNIKEKETLIKELHHRVKNNMQVISSMLSLQSNLIDDSAVKNIFQDSQQRIKSMAAIHDLLYKSYNLSEIDFSEYINTLTTDLIHSYVGSDNSIQMNFEISNVRFNLEKAIPLGLFINEIVTNSLKHGFITKKSGEIKLKLETLADGHFYMEISDNGQGFNIKEQDSNETLGLMLIENLSEQLDGTLTRNSSSEGTIYTLLF
jgi:PAS domain S-box-containing protein